MHRKRNSHSFQVYVGRILYRKLQWYGNILVTTSSAAAGDSHLAQISDTAERIEASQTGGDAKRDFSDGDVPDWCSCYDIYGPSQPKSGGFAGHDFLEKITKRSVVGRLERLISE